MNHPFLSSQPFACDSPCTCQPLLDSSKARGGGETQVRHPAEVEAEAAKQPGCVTEQNRTSKRCSAPPLGTSIAFLLTWAVRSLVPTLCVIYIWAQ